MPITRPAKPANTLPRKSYGSCSSRWALLVIATALLAASDSVDAAVPTVSHIYPGGCQVGKTTDITITSNQADKRLQVWCDRKGVVFEPGEKPAHYKVAVAPDVRSGLCWVRFFNDEGSADARPFLLGTSAEINETEPNNRLDEATAAKELPVIANGVLEKSADVDCFQFEASAGQTIVASVTANEWLGSPVDCVLQVVSPAGFVVTQNDDDHGNDPQVVVKAETSGTYVARVFGFPDKPNSTVNFAGAATFVYRLQITNAAFLDHTQPLAVNSADVQNLQAVGWNVPKGQTVKPVVREDGRSADVSIANGNWRELPAFPVPVVVESEQSAKQLVTIPVAVSGVLSEPKQVDGYSFAAKKGDNLWFRCLSRSLGQPTDPVIRVVNADGTTLKEHDDIARYKEDCDLTYRIPSDGTYGVEVRDRFDAGGWRFAYVLVIEKVVPDYSLSLAAGHFVLKPDKPLEIPVTVNRLNGFSGEITVSFNGLPNGVKAEPVVSLPKGDTAKSVKLKLSMAADTEFASGVIAVTGKSDTHVRIATAPTSIADQSIPTVWLTTIGVKPAKAKY